MKEHRFLVFNFPFYLELFASITAILVYMSGVGRFRFVLAYAIFLIVRAALAACTISIKDIAVVPIVILALVFDFKYGAFYPIYGFNNILLAGILLVACDAIIRKVIQIKIGSAVSSGYFQICPNCRCLQSELVTWCNKCGYKTSEFGSKHTEATLISQIINTTNRQNHKDAALYQMSLPRTIAFYKNSARELRNHLFMTEDCLAIVEIRGENAWRDGDIIPYNDITSITAEMKKSFISKSPFLTIKCKNGNVFEIVLPSTDKYKQHIIDIQSIANKINKEILIETNISDEHIYRS